MKAKQENIVKERERKLAQKELEKEREQQRQLEAKQAEKNRQKKQVRLVLFVCFMFHPLKKALKRKDTNGSKNIIPSVFLCSKPDRHIVLYNVTFITVVLRYWIRFLNR